MLGRHSPDYQTLKRIAKALKVPTAYFYAESDELAKVISSFGQLSKKSKSEVLKIIETD